MLRSARHLGILLFRRLEIPSSVVLVQVQRVSKVTADDLSLIRTVGGTALCLQNQDHYKDHTADALLRPISDGNGDGLA